jgi:hypothetical protein
MTRANPFSTPLDRILYGHEDLSNGDPRDFRVTSRDMKEVAGGLVGLAGVFSPENFGDDADLEGIGIDHDDPFFEAEGNGLIANIKGTPIIDFYMGDTDRISAIQLACQAELCFNKSVGASKRRSCRTRRGSKKGGENALLLG